MSADLIINQADEAQEPEKKRAELAGLEARLSQRESELAKLQSDLRSFETRYLDVVGRRYDELAEIEAQIAQAQGLDSEQAEETWSAADEVGCGQNRFHSEKIKKLYREVAKKFHPDLAADEQERHHRHQLMIEINRAYESRSEEHLQALLEAGLNCAESGGSDGATELVLLTRRLAQVKERLVTVDEEIAQITASEIYKLKLRVENAEAVGLDLLADLVAQVERQITKARNRLVHLQSVMMTG